MECQECNWWLILYKVEAVVRSSRFYLVQGALAEIGVVNFSAYQIKLAGIIREKKIGAGTFKTSNLLQKTKIEIICGEKEKNKIIDTISKSAKTGQTGDGIVFSQPINDLVKIRTGTTGEEAVK